MDEIEKLKIFNSGFRNEANDKPAIKTNKAAAKRFGDSANFAKNAHPAAAIIISINTAIVNLFIKFPYSSCLKVLKVFCRRFLRHVCILKVIKSAS